MKTTKIKEKNKALIRRQLDKHFREFVIGGNLSFTKKLAKENNWSMEYAGGAILEYKRFMYLVMVEDVPLTPSDEVDQVWHLHLQHSRNYEKMCKIHGSYIHHEPEVGTKKDIPKFNEPYQLTKDKYLMNFYQEAPEQYWPDSETRFSKSPNAIRVNLFENVVIPKEKYEKTAFQVKMLLAVLVAIIGALLFK